MTHTSPKSRSHHNSNGRGSYSNSQSVRVEGLTSATNLSSNSVHRVQSAPEIKPIQLPQPEVTLPYAHTSKSPRRGKLSQWFSSSLRVKTTIVAIAIGTIPAIAIGTMSYFTVSNQVREQVIQSDRNTMDDLKDKIFYFVRERAADIQILANLPMLANPKVASSLKLEEKEAVLDRYLEIYKVYDSIAIYDLNGKAILKSEGKIIEDVSDLDYFQQPMKTGRLFISEPRIAQATGIFSFFISIPVKDDVTGQTVAILRTRLPFKSVQEVFNVNAQRGQKFYLIDASGKIATADKDSLIGKKLEAVFPNLLTKVKKEELEKLDSKSIIGSAKDEQTTEQELITYSRANRLRPYFGLDWSFILAQSAEKAFAAERQLLWTVFLGTAAATLAVGAIAAYIAGRATRPILDATQAVEKIGQGELDTRVEIPGEDELAVLGSNINEMAGQLEVFAQEQEFAAEQAVLVAKVTGSRAENSQALEQLFEDVIEEARNILNVDRVVIYRFNSDGGGYITAESVASGFPRAFNNKAEEFFVSDVQDVTNPEDFIVAIHNIYESGIYGDHLRLLERWQVKSKLAVPIFHEGMPMGMLIAHHCAEPHEWQDSEANFLKQLAAQMGLALDRVILLEETEKLAQEQEQLALEQQQLKESLQKRALELLQEVDPISKGDLTIRAKVTADEIGTIADSYNAMVGSLRKIVTEVQRAALQVAQTTSTSEVSVQELSVEALRQAEQIAQALQQAQEMAHMVHIVAENANKAETAVQQAAMTVQEGDAAMNRTVDGILAIRETVAETAKKVKHLGESSQKISTVVNLISTFAAQTNLLALNASIEAARAGEEGRGFAVVADEVRSLARQSAEATTEIEKLVAEIQGETNEVVAAMEAGTEQVVTGTKLVDATRQSLNKITAASTEINKLVEEIAHATVIQSQASETVTKTMTDVAAIASHTSAGASQVSNSFKELLAVAQALQEDVGQFRVN
ncbi:MAG TPA: methyl-accepting chemotaxis protein [Allocoleopsis sp.]